jgi:hypothetical protein
LPEGLRDKKAKRHSQVHIDTTTVGTGVPTGSVTTTSSTVKDILQWTDSIRNPLDCGRRCTRHHGRRQNVKNLCYENFIVWRARHD